MDLAFFYIVGIAFIVVGIIIVVASVILISVSKTKKGKVGGAGIIMLGPIPIIFGTDKGSIKVALTVGLVLTVLILTVIVIYWLGVNWAV